MVTIIAHELAHYGGAFVMGAQDLRLHWADITFAAGSLSQMGEAVTWAAGPLITHAIILWVWLSRATSVVALSLGLGACSRDIVLLPFTIKTILGRDVSGFSGDEVEVANALGFAPLPLAVFAVALGLGGLVVFLARAYRKGGGFAPVALIIGTVLGIAMWSFIGPMVLAGGKGIG